jgi:hypothetical protein
MKVSKLIEELKKQDQNLEVIMYDGMNEGHSRIEKVIEADTNKKDEEGYMTDLKYDKGDDPISCGWIKKGDKFLYLAG